MSTIERACPTCGRPIDPLRAPVARVSGGKIVTYCSSDCARGIAPPPLDPIPDPMPDPIPDAAVASAPAPEPPAPEAVAARAPTESDITPPPELALGTAHAREDSIEVPAPAPVPSVPGRRRGARVFGAIAALALAVGAGWFVVSRGPRASSAGEPHAPTEQLAVAPEPPPPPAPAPLDPARLVADARAALSRTLGDPSPRVRLLGAKALSRVRDPAALAELRKLLADDPSEIRRLEVAYALARAGDVEGREYLVGALRGSRRDTRLEAARSLAALGDARGRDRLRDAMSLTTLRLGAAESLARLGDPDGIAALREALGGRNEEHRMRAAVALGRVGDRAGIDLLREMVADNRIEMGEAAALARLGEPGAEPQLERMLGLTAFRVEAALALRQLGARPPLEPLAATLETGDEIGRVTAAEAILILYDPELPTEAR